MEPTSYINYLLVLNQGVIESYSPGFVVEYIVGLLISGNSTVNATIFTRSLQKHVDVSS